MKYYDEIEMIFKSGYNDESIQKLSELCMISHEEAERAIYRYESLEKNMINNQNNTAVYLDIQSDIDRLFIAYASLAEINNTQTYKF